MVSQVLEASAEVTDFSHIAMLVQKIEVKNTHFLKGAKFCIFMVLIYDVKGFFYLNSENKLEKGNFFFFY